MSLRRARCAFESIRARAPRAGVGLGDAVAIAMPMTIEAVIAYLGIVKAGAVVVSIADSFAPDEIRTRMQIARARFAITQDVIVRGEKTLPMYAKLVEAGVRSVRGGSARQRAPGHAARLRPRLDSVSVASPTFEAAAASPTQTTNILVLFRHHR